MEGSHAVSDEHESNALEVSLEPNSVQNTNTNQRTEAFNIFGESEYFESLKLVNVFFKTPFQFFVASTDHFFHLFAVFYLFSFRLILLS